LPKNTGIGRTGSNRWYFDNIGNVAGHSDFLGMEMQITLQAGGNAEKIVSKMYL